MEAEFAQQKATPFRGHNLAAPPTSVAQSWLYREHCFSDSSHSIREIAMELFAIVADTFTAPPPEVLAPLLLRIVGCTKIDANHRANHARGIVAERLAAEPARYLLAELNRHGIAAQLAPQKLVPASVRGRRVHLVLPSADKFGVRWSITGQPRWYAWSEVAVVSAGVVFHEQKERVIQTEEVVRMDRRAVAAQTTIIQKDVSRDVGMAMISLGRSPVTLEHLRIRAQEVEYPTIFGADLRSGWLENFCRLLAKIGTSAEQAYVTDETIEFVATASTAPRLPKQPRFATETEFDDYQRFLVTKHLLASWQAGGSASPDPVG